MARMHGYRDRGFVRRNTVPTFFHESPYNGIALRQREEAALGSFMVSVDDVLRVKALHPVYGGTTWMTAREIDLVTLAQLPIASSPRSM